MAELTADLAPKVVEACAANAEGLAAAFGRALDGEYVVKAGDPRPRGEIADEALAGGGLLLTVAAGSAGLLAALPTSSGLIPGGAKAPDAEGEAKLTTLAEEMGSLLLPEGLSTAGHQAAWSDDLLAAVERSAPADDAIGLTIEVARGETLGQLTLLWPVSRPEAALTDGGEAATGQGAAVDPVGTTTPGGPAAPFGKLISDLRDLPPNSLNALRVEVPVSVCLAGRKMAVEEVIGLGPGSIISFEKRCDDPVEVCVGDRPIAEGSPVKVGDLFGVKLQGMILPSERFRPLLPAERSHD